MDPTRRQFTADAKDIVDRLYADLQQLRILRSEGRQRRELASRIFRHVHTLKGAAGSMSFASVTDVAHELEGILDGVRLGRIAIDDEVLNLFEEATDLIAEELSNTSRPDASKTHALVVQLRSVASQASPQAALDGSLRSALPEDIARSLSEYDLQHAREAVHEGARLFIVDASLPIDTFDTRFRALMALLGNTGEVVATVPAPPANPDEINFRLLYAAGLISDPMRRGAAEFGTCEFNEVPVESDEAAGAMPTVIPASLPQGDSRATSVRVGLKQLDDLTASVTDLLRDTSNALVTVQKAADASVARAAASNLRRQFVNLEERLIKLRLIPLSDLLNGAAARAGRVAARQMKKDIAFEIIGGDVGIDKSLAELIAEPLLHLVRNAVSHGIESQQERIAAGKSSNGLVRLHGFSEGSRIYITVSDDGRGIDVDEIAAAATRQGIVSRPSDLTEDQALRLIFRPGFSTTSETSQIAGRGVGLEIVDRAMAQAGGDVRLTSEPGKGATFAMMIPATLALISCVVARCGEQFYCLDSDVVTDRATFGDKLPLNDDGQSITWQDEQLPLLRLDYLLGTTGSVQPEGSRAVLICDPGLHRLNVGTHRNRVAVVADGIAGQQETLVRSLGPHAALWHGISGAAELLDGSIALMIDLARLIEANES